MENPALFSCHLCGGVLPASSPTDEVFVNHMTLQHRTYLNLDFFHAMFFLDKDGIEKAQQFICKLTLFSSSKSLQQKEQSRDCDLKTKEIEYDVENRQESATQITKD